MAEVAVQVLLQHLVKWLAEEAKFLLGVADQVKDAKIKLVDLRLFLKDAEERSRNNERVRNWTNELREAVFDLEDVLERFATREASAGGGAGGSRRRRCCYCFGVDAVFGFADAVRLQGVYELHNTGLTLTGTLTRIDNLKSEVERLGITESNDSSAGDGADHGRVRERRRSFGHTNERDFVGFREDVEKLVPYLTELPHRVVAICGMGGLGKTTLAKHMYHHNCIRGHFKRFAWASISHSYQVRDVLQEILLDLTRPTPEERNEIKSMSESELRKKLYQVQQKNKCLVVLDDIWTMETWDDLRAAFPDDGTESRILLTTRSKAVAQYADQNGILHEPKCMDDDESWELFKKKVRFPGNTEQEKTDMEKLGREMVRQYCAGLPLAIIVLAGLLSSKRTVPQWYTLSQNVKAYMNKDPNTGVMEVLGLSYTELPYHLKPCFLHLSLYPEDSEIRVKELCHLWIAEGFVSFSLEDGIPVEEMAYECVEQLAERCMIQVGKYSSTGLIKTCRIHDLMRDLSLQKARDQNFLRVVIVTDQSVGINYSKVRRLVIHLKNDGVLGPSIKNTDTCLRTLISFNPEYIACGQAFELLINRFRMLRVLKFENAGRVELSDDIGQLILLRFLSLNGSDVEQLPSSIGNLECLEFLDLRVAETSSPLKIPKKKIQRLTRLRHLYLPQRLKLRGRRLRLADDGNLRTLVNISMKSLDPFDSIHLANLTKLKTFDGQIDPEEIFRPSFILSGVTSLGIVVEGMANAAVDIKPIISCCPKIYKLHLALKVKELPGVETFSKDLKKLTLAHTFLRNDPMPVLEMLPSLKVLSLNKKAFMGREMVCSDGGFKSLESLSLVEQENLESWTIIGDALAELVRLKIIGCNKLRTELLPERLRHLLHASL